MSKKKTNDIRLSEKLSLSTGIGVQNIMYGFVTAYVIIFFTDVYGISAALAGTIVLVSGLWDAVNDPMMGIIADKTRTKCGKFRPYMFAAIPAAIVYILLFTVPDLNETGKVIWAFATYIIYQMFYTVQDIPLWSLTAVMTKDTNKRTSLITLCKILGLFGGVIPIVFAASIINKFGGGAKGYQSLAIIIAVLGMIFIPAIFFFTKERVVSSKKKPSAFKLLKVIVQNKPLLLILSSHLIRSLGTALLITSLTYFTKYNLGNEETMMLIMVLYFVPATLGMIVIPMLSKRFDKKLLIIVAVSLQVLAFVALYLVGYASLTNILIVVGFIGFFMGLIDILIPAMFTETIDYSEWKLGTRAEGMVWSTQTLAVKAGTAIGGLVLGIILTSVGYVQNAVQTTSALNGIHMTISLVVGGIFLISLIPIFFYSLTRDKYKKLMSELEQRRASAKENESA